MGRSPILKGMALSIRLRIDSIQYICGVKLITELKRVPYENNESPN